MDSDRLIPIVKNGLVTILIGFSNLLFGQPSSGHFQYGLIKFEILDSSRVTEEDLQHRAEMMDSEFRLDLYYNPESAVMVRKGGTDNWKSYLDRKHDLLYVLYEQPNGNFYTLDSIPDPDSPGMQATFDSIKIVYQIHERRDIRKTIFGFDCYRIEFPTTEDLDILDGSMYVTEQLNIPSAIFQDASPIIRGIPLEVSFPDDGIAVVMGVISFDTPIRDESVFKLDISGFTQIHH